MTTRQFNRRFVGSSLLVSTATILFISCYLAALLRLSHPQWRTFGYLVTGMFPIFFVIVQLFNTKMRAPVLSFLRSEEEGRAAPEQRREAFRVVSALPVWQWCAGLGWWSIAGLGMALGMRLCLEAVPSSQLAIVCVGLSSGGFISATFHYFVNRELYRDLLEDLAVTLGDSRQHREHVRKVSLLQKLVVSVVGVSCVMVIFAMLLALVNSGESLERGATRTQLAFLREVVRQNAAAGPIDLRGEERRANRLAIAEHLLLVEAKTGVVVGGPKQLLTEIETEMILSESSGTSAELASGNVLSWISLPEEGLTLVAVTPWLAVHPDLARDVVMFCGTLAACGLVSLMLVFFLSRDVGSRTRRLREAVERVASGDLRAEALLEAEDELGELAWAFESMAKALRSTVGRVAEAANLVESTATGISEISQRIAAGAGDQSRGVQRGVDALGGMNAQVAGISSAAQELNLLAEESSSSILEMGTAGTELNDTAGVLSSRVEEVSSSVEEMVRSVKEVNSHTGVLSDAATQTSSRMEEMARAMCQIDSTAEEAAALSRDAVRAADGGRETAQQASEGMESIRLATATAEDVIRGLGSRVKEIGLILDVIGDVTDETNLLALNAAIIAAQAGEQGRAFSVVADEIKELANRVLASTKEIGDLIRAVQTESDNAIEAIAEGSRSVADGVEYSRAAGAALVEITRSSQESGERIQEIVTSVRDQSRAASHVVGMMESVSTRAEAIHRASEEQDRGNEVVYRSMNAMREMAQQLLSTTEEQARGGARIRESTGGVREAAESINGALQSQSRACQEVTGFLDEVSSCSQANGVSSDHLATATRSLLAQAEALRQDVKKFVLDS